MQHGTSGASAYGYGVLGRILGPVFHRYSEGYRFGRLACDLVEKHGFISYEARINVLMGGVALWTQPITTAIDFMRAPFASRPRQGILLTLATACGKRSQAFSSGMIRSTRYGASRRGSLDFVRRARFRDVADIIVSQQRFIATMQGRAATFSTFSDEQFDEATFEAQLTGDRMP